MVGKVIGGSSVGMVGMLDICSRIICSLLWTCCNNFAKIWGQDGSVVLSSYNKIHELVIIQLTCVPALSIPRFDINLEHTFGRFTDSSCRFHCAITSFRAAAVPLIYQIISIARILSECTIQYGKKTWHHISKICAYYYQPSSGQSYPIISYPVFPIQKHMTTCAHL